MYHSVLFSALVENEVRKLFEFIKVKAWKDAPFEHRFYFFGYLTFVAREARRDFYFDQNKATKLVEMNHLSNTDSPLFFLLYLQVIPPFPLLNF